MASAALAADLFENALIISFEIHAVSDGDGLQAWQCLAERESRGQILYPQRRRTLKQDGRNADFKVRGSLEFDSQQITRIVSPFLEDPTPAWANQGQ